MDSLKGLKRYNFRFIYCLVLMLYAILRVYSVCIVWTVPRGLVQLISGFAARSGLYGLQGLECLKGLHVLYLQYLKLELFFCICL